jgi:hypothetical protein
VVFPLPDTPITSTISGAMRPPHMTRTEGPSLLRVGLVSVDRGTTGGLSSG